MASLENLLQSAEGNSLEVEDLVLFAEQQGLTAIGASEFVSLHVAQSFAGGRIDYVTGDRIMNSMINLVTTKEFFAISGGVVPALVLSIYQAFDEGEYVHSGDTPDVDTESKYTKPMIAAVLGKQDIF
jgi:hypothetical protein